MWDNASFLSQMTWWTWYRFQVWPSASVLVQLYCRQHPPQLRQCLLSIKLSNNQSPPVWQHLYLRWRPPLVPLEVYLPRKMSRNLWVILYWGRQTLGLPNRSLHLGLSLFMCWPQSLVYSTFYLFLNYWNQSSMGSYFFIGEVVEDSEFEKRKDKCSQRYEHGGWTERISRRDRFSHVSASIRPHHSRPRRT